MANEIYLIKEYYPELTLEILKEFLDTHYTDLILNPEFNTLNEFKEWVYINHYLDF